MESISPPVVQLKVLTLNCWGLKFLSSQRRERIKAIGDWIQNSNRTNSNTSSYDSSESEPEPVQQGTTGSYDVICLQEIWIESDFDSIRTKAKSVGLVHSKFFHSGAIGSGLAILSAHPITSSFIHPYSLNGYPLHFIEGDFYAGKCVCGITIKVNNQYMVDVLNTHLYAPGGEGDNLEGCHRIGQIWELSKIVREKSERGRYVILAGDFNSQPQSLIIRLLTSFSSLHDSFSLTNPTPPSISSSIHSSMTPIEKMKSHGITCDSPLNSYSAPKLKSKNRLDEIIIRGGKRLDYIFFRSPMKFSSNTMEEDEVLVPISTQLVLTDPIPHLNYSYSDHFGVSTLFSFLPSSLSTLPPSPPPHLSLSDLETSLSLLSLRLSHSISSSKSQLSLLFLSILLIPILLIASSFQPLKKLNWLFVLLGIGIGAGGSTMLYSGFVFGRWEEGNLRNLIGEMEDERNRIESGERYGR